jgi:hypothetical protein
MVWRMVGGLAVGWLTALLMATSCDDDPTSYVTKTKSCDKLGQCAAPHSCNNEFDCWCAKGQNGATCSRDSDCAEGEGCAFDTCACDRCIVGENGATCSRNSDCASGEVCDRDSCQCGPPGSGGNGGQGAGGSGGSAPACATCLDAVIDPSLASAAFCAGSEAVADALTSCACNTAPCDTQCANMCNGTTTMDSPCASCLGFTCTTEAEACVADSGNATSVDLYNCGNTMFGDVCYSEPNCPSQPAAPRDPCPAMGGLCVYCIANASGSIRMSCNEFDDWHIVQADVDCSQ